MKLRKLAEDARFLMEGDDKKWVDDPWLSQLDWTPKTAGKSRGISPIISNERISPELDTVDVGLTDTKPAWFLQVVSEPFAKSTIERVVPILLSLSFNGHPLHYNTKQRWYYLLDDQITPLELIAGKKTLHILSRYALKLFKGGQMCSVDPELTLALCGGQRNEETRHRIITLAESILRTPTGVITNDPWLSQLDWTPVPSAPDRKSVV